MLKAQGKPRRENPHVLKGKAHDFLRDMLDEDLLIESKRARDNTGGKTLPCATPGRIQHTIPHRMLPASLQRRFPRAISYPTGYDPGAAAAEAAATLDQTF